MCRHSNFRAHSGLMGEGKKLYQMDKGLVTKTLDDTDENIFCGWTQFRRFQILFISPHSAAFDVRELNNDSKNT